MAWVPSQSKIAMAHLCQNSPIDPLVIQRTVLWPLLSLWTLCLLLLLAHALHSSFTAFLVVLTQTRHVAATGPLHWLLPWPETLFLRCPHSSLSPSLYVSTQVATDQFISEALLITHRNTLPLPWFICLVFLITIRHITYLLVYFLSSPSKRKFHEGRNCVLFTALKMPGSQQMLSKYLLNGICEWVIWWLRAIQPRKHSALCSQYF